MPTGYTAPIMEGDGISFRDFAIHCSKAFLHDFRDRDFKEVPAPDAVPSPYYAKRLEESRADLAKFQTMSKECIVTEWKAYNERMQERRDEAARIEKMEAERYGYMRSKVEGWQVTEEYEGIKRFMLEQISISHREDHAPGWSKEECDERFYPLFPTPEAFYAEKIAECQKEVERATESLQKEIGRVNQRNAWVQGLIDALPAA